MSTRTRIAARQPVGLIALCAIMVALLWASLLFDLDRMKANALKQAHRDGNNLIVAFEDSVNKTIGAIDQMMISVVADNSVPGFHSIPQWVRSSPLFKELKLQISIVGTDGKIAASTMILQGGTDVSDRPHIRHHFDINAPQPHISAPVIERNTGNWTLQFTRRIVHENGRIGGVVVIGLDAFYFSRIFENINLGDNSLLALTGLDGIVRSRRALGSSVTGQDISGTTLFELIKKTGSGSIAARSQVDGIDRIFTYATVRNYPLYVLIGLAETDVLAVVNEQKVVYLSVGGGLTVAIGALGCLLVRTSKQRRKRELIEVAEEKVREQKAFLDVALNNMRDGLVMFDKDNKVLVLNRRYLEMYNLKNAKPGCTFRDLLVEAASVGNFALDGGIEAYVKARLAQSGATERTIETLDGRSINIVRRSMEDGGWVVTHEDITHRKFHEQQLLQLNSELENRVRVRSAELAELQEQAYATQIHAQKMEAIGKLTGGMAHDFNNYLGIIIGNLDLARHLPTDDPMVKNLIDEAMSGAMRNSELTKSLLAFSRRQPLAPQRTDIGAVLTADATLLKRTLRQGIDLTTELAPDLWRANIDRAQLDSCIINLIKNAGDAIPETREGAVVIAARNMQIDEKYASENREIVPGDYVLIEISDNGAGMSPEIVNHVFEPFFTTKPAGHGTGLGLSMVYGFVKQSGGYIDAHSEVGRGTRISIYLPRDAGDDIEKTAAGPEPTVRTGGSETILVVDDNEMMRRTAVAQLASCGYQVIEAEDGQAGLRILEQPDRHIDLLFTDIVMPGGIDGYNLAELAYRLRPGIRILLTSGFPGDPTREKTPQSESLPLLIKPYRFDTLSSVIRMTLDGRGQTPSPPTQPYDIAQEAAMPCSTPVSAIG